MSEDLVIKLCDERAALQEQLERTQAELERRTAWSNEQLRIERTAYELLSKGFGELKAEVARLREYAAACERTAGLNQQENVTLKLDLATERAAHEATERSRQEATDRALGIAAKLDETVRAHEATKAELAGLGADYGKLLKESNAFEARVAELERIHEQALNERDAAHAALDQARGLLERWKARKWGVSLDNDTAEFLIRHPATPAATGAERQHCSEHAGWRSDCEQCAEKGQGT